MPKLQLASRYGGVSSFLDLAKSFQDAQRQMQWQKEMLSYQGGLKQQEMSSQQTIAQRHDAMTLLHYGVISGALKPKKGADIGDAISKYFSTGDPGALGDAFEAGIPGSNKPAYIANQAKINSKDDALKAVLNLPSGQTYQDLHGYLGPKYTGKADPRGGTIGEYKSPLDLEDPHGRASAFINEQGADPDDYANELAALQSGVGASPGAAMSGAPMTPYQKMMAIVAAQKSQQQPQAAVPQPNAAPTDEEENQGGAAGGSY